MKKLLSALLAISLIFSMALFVSCGSSDDKNTNGTTENTTKSSTTRRPPDIEPEAEPETESIKVGTAAELVEAINKFNNWDVALDSSITLTADIDMSDYSDPTAYEPIYEFSGVFDGAGHTISNLNWTMTMANDATSNMPNPASSAERTYVISAIEDNGSVCEAGISLLIIHLKGGTVKNLTIKDSSVNIVCSYNKNYHVYVAGMVAYATDGKVLSCNMENVNVNVPEALNTNQGFAGYAALLVGCAKNSAVIYNCKVKGTVDTTTNVKFNAAGLLGTFPDSEGTLTIADCDSSGATLNVCPPENLVRDNLMYKEGDLGGNSDPDCCDHAVDITTTYTPE